MYNLCNHIQFRSQSIETNEKYDNIIHRWREKLKAK